jgi:hypothetical protein
LKVAPLAPVAALELPVLVVAPEFPLAFAEPQWTPNLQLNLVRKAARPELQADESEWEQAR